MAERKQEQKTTAFRIQKRDATTPTAAPYAPSPTSAVSCSPLRPGVAAVASAMVDRLLLAQCKEMYTAMAAHDSGLNATGTPHIKSPTPQGRQSCMKIFFVVASHCLLLPTLRAIFRVLIGFWVYGVASAPAALATAASAAREALWCQRGAHAGFYALCRYIRLLMLPPVYGSLRRTSSEVLHSWRLSFDTERRASRYNLSISKAAICPRGTHSTAVDNTTSHNTGVVYRSCHNRGKVSRIVRALSLPLLVLYYLAYTCCCAQLSPVRQNASASQIHRPSLVRADFTYNKAATSPACTWTTNVLPQRSAPPPAVSHTRASVSDQSHRYLNTANEAGSHNQLGLPLRARTLLHQQQMQRLALLQQYNPDNQKTVLPGPHSSPVVNRSLVQGSAVYHYRPSSTVTGPYAQPHAPYLVDNVVPVGHAVPKVVASSVPLPPYPYSSGTAVAPITPIPVRHMRPGARPPSHVLQHCADCEPATPALATGWQRTFAHPYVVPRHAVPPCTTVLHPQRSSSHPHIYETGGGTASSRVHLSGRIVHTPAARSSIPSRASNVSWVSVRSGSRGIVAVPPSRPGSRPSSQTPPRVHIVHSSAPHATSGRGSVHTSSAAGAPVIRQSTGYIPNSPSGPRRRVSSIHRRVSLVPAVIPSPHHPSNSWAARRHSFSPRDSRGSHTGGLDLIRSNGGPTSAQPARVPMFDLRRVSVAKRMAGSALAQELATTVSLAHGKGFGGEDPSGDQHVSHDARLHSPRVKETNGRKRRKATPQNSTQRERASSHETDPEAWREAEEDIDEEEAERGEHAEHKDQEEESEEDNQEGEELQVSSPVKMPRVATEMLSEQHHVIPREWDYRKSGVDWAVGRGGCASHTRQSPINFDETQRPLSQDEAATLELQQKDEERRATLNAEAAASGRRTTRVSGIRKTYFPTLKRKLSQPVNLLVDATEDGTKSVQLRLSTGITRYTVELMPGKKIEFEPEKFNSTDNSSSKKRRELMSSFGFVRVEGKIYDVINFHFHSPAEHTFNMKRRALELHIVCQHTASDLVVIGLTFETVGELSAPSVDDTGRSVRSKDAGSNVASFATASRIASQAAVALEGREASYAGRTPARKLRAEDGEGAAADTKKSRVGRKVASLAVKEKRPRKGAVGIHEERLPTTVRGTRHLSKKKRREKGANEGDYAQPTKAVTEEEADKLTRGGSNKAKITVRVSPGAHNFMVAVTEAIRLTQQAALGRNEDGHRETGTVSRTLGEGLTAKTGAAAAPRRRLKNEDHKQREGEEPLGSTLRGAPWMYSEDLHGSRRSSAQKWARWAEFETSTTAGSSQDSSSSSRTGLFPLVRNLPPVPQELGTEQLLSRRRKERNGKQKSRRQQQEEDEDEKESAAEPLAGSASGEARKRKRARASVAIPERKRTRDETRGPEQYRSSTSPVWGEHGELQLPPINLQALLDNTSSIFFRYKGSLTTPPCSETVLWYVLKDPIFVEAQLLKTLQSLLQCPGLGVSGTYRVLQNAEGRDNNREIVYMVKAAS